MKTNSIGKIVPAAVLATAFATFAAAQTSQTGSTTRQQRLEAHVYYLASDSLQGRKAGSEYARKAAAYIQKNYEEIGLKPFFSDWQLPFSRPVSMIFERGTFSNVVGLIEGSDPELKNEYIVLGAHYDHLGTKADGTVFNGADDNASGSAALIEIARELYANRGNLKRSVIIAAFDAEEIGLVGSNALADTLSQSIGEDRIKLMMSIDMVGWYKATGELKLEGVATIKDGKQVVTSAASGTRITVNPVRFEKSLFTATDTQGFAQKKVPTLAVTTGLKSPYHKPGDDADKIDYEGLDNVTGYLADLAGNIASDPAFKGSGRVARKHSGKAPFLEAGVLGGIGSGNIQFGGSSIRTKSNLNLAGGVGLNLNIKNFGIRSGALYESFSSYYPDDSNPYGSKLGYNQKGITVPVAFVAQTDFPQRFFFGGGAYFTHILNTSFFTMPDKGDSQDVAAPHPAARNQGGALLTAGFQFGGLCYSADFFFSTTKVFTEGAPVKAFLQYSRFTVSYFF